MMIFNNNCLIKVSIFLLVLTFAFAQEKKTLAIYPFDGVNVSSTTLSVFSAELESKLMLYEKFRMVTRERIEKVIQEQNFQVSCSANECAIELGKFLSADIITGKITKMQNNRLHFVVKVLETETGVIHSALTREESGDEEDILFDIAKEIAKELSEKMIIPASMDFGMEQPSGASVLIDGKLTGYTPKYGMEIPPGEHEISIQKTGYETWKKQFTLLEGKNDYIAPITSLTPKSRFKAFRKSLLFPGLGQYYSSDEDHRGRTISGVLFSAVGISFLAGTGTLWADYYSAQTAYDKSVQDYNDQVFIEAIQTYRGIMEDKHQLMADANKAAFLVSGITAGIWIINALEAVIFYPNDYGMKETEYSLGITPLPGSVIFPSITITRNF